MTDPRWAAEVELSPAFHDLDPMEIVWHGHYVKYLELARCALLAQIDYDYPQMRASGYAWPVVDLRLKFVRPARYAEPFRLRAVIVEWENRLKIQYLARELATGAKLTQGHTIQVAVEIASGEMCYETPPVLWQKLGLEPP